MTTATHEDDTSASWQGRCPGSVFAAAIINTLTSTSSPLLDDRTGGTEEESLQPEEPTPEQEKTYDEFCRSILNVCKNGPFEERSIANIHTSNEAFAGAPELSKLSRVTEAAFFTDETTGLTCHKRVSPMAELFLQTCPGDESSGWGPMVRNRLRSSTEKNLPQDDPEEVAGLISFRWELGLLADYLVEIFGLPQPGGKICVLWNSQPWYSEAIKCPLHSIILPDMEDQAKRPWLNPKDKKLSPITYGHQAKTPTLFMMGTRDVRTPAAVGEEMMFMLLKHLRVPTALIRFEGAGHAIFRSRDARHPGLAVHYLLRWMDLHLKGVPAPEFDVKRVR